jgi:urease accessory protein
MTTRKRISLLVLSACASLAPIVAHAHHLPGENGGFAAGLNHPIHGLDHILAMVAVGIWAAQLGGRALWVVPAAFVAAMAGGGALGMMGLQLPGVETGILVSVLVLGLLIAAGARLPLAASAALVGLFAIFHGHAHGMEIPAASSGLAYALGFVVATACLHACGVALGCLAQKRLPVPTLRYAGAAIALGGLCLWLA